MTTTGRALILACLLAPMVAWADEAPQGPGPKPQPAWLGLELAPGKAGGVGIKRVVEGSPAEAARLAAGDEVLLLDGVEVKEMGQLASSVRKNPVGTRVVLTLAGEPRREVAVVLAARPDPRALLQALVDKPAPDVPGMKDKAALSGPPVGELASLRGHVVLLDFFATWCGPCIEALPRVVALHRELGDKGLRVVGISSEDAATVAPFARDRALPYSVIADESEELPTRFRVFALPTVVVLDRAGVVRYAQVGHIEDAAAMVRLLLEEKRDAAGAAGASDPARPIGAGKSRPAKGAAKGKRR